MSNKTKVVNINSYKREKKQNKNNKNNNKLFLILFAFAVLSLFVWKNFISDNSKNDLIIPESKEISYDLQNIKQINPNEIIDRISKNNLEGKPTLIYLYTSWCSVCKKQLPIINEIARKYQNTDLDIISVVIDKNITKEKAIDTLKILKEIYFEPQFLVNRGDFNNLLKAKSINFGKRVPFTVLIDRNSKIISQFSGGKSLNFLEKKVIKLLSNFKDEN